VRSNKSVVPFIGPLKTYLPKSPVELQPLKRMHELKRTLRPHIQRDNFRLVLMFCTVDGAPQDGRDIVLRLTNLLGSGPLGRT